MEKLLFFQRGKKEADSFGPKIAFFPTSFFFGKRDKEKGFYDILERKNAFPGYKNKQFKKSKKFHFSKGVNP